MYNFKVVTIIIGWALAHPISACNSFNELQSSILKVEKEVKQKMLNVHSNATRVLVVGTAGGGKSSLIHNLLGIPVFASKYEGSMVVIPERMLDGIKISHDCNAGTTIPELVYDEKNEFIYCDCPGFFDPRGPEQEIINLFAIDQLFSHSDNVNSKIKIILVMSEGEFNGSRGAISKKVFFKVSKLLPKIEELKASIVFVLTKANKSVNMVELFRWLLKGFDNDLVKFLASNQERLFTFFNPNEEDLGKEVSVKNRDRLINEIKESPVLNPEHAINLTQNEKALVSKLARSFNVRQEIMTFSKELLSQASKIDDIDLLSEWRIAVFCLQNSDLRMPKDFVDKVKSIGLFNGLFEKTLDKMLFLDGFYSFCNTVFPDSEERKSICPRISVILEDWLDFCYNDISNLIDVKEGKVKMGKFILSNKERDDELKRLEEKSEHIHVKFSRQREDLYKQVLLERKALDTAYAKIKDMEKAISQLNNTIEKLKEELAIALSNSEKYKEEIENCKAEISKQKNRYDNLQYEYTKALRNALDVNQEWKDKMDKIMRELCYDCRSKVERISRSDECAIL